MRPGLGKPGALPLLALIVFSLLTLVPSLSSIYNIKAADFAYYSTGARQVPLIKDSVAELSSESHPVDHRRSWILAAQQRPRVNRPSRSSQAGNSGASVLPSEIEIGPVVNKSRLSYAAPESSFLFSRRARAFRTYFVQQLDDYQFFTPFSHRTLPAETMKPSTPASSDRSPSPTSTHNCDSDHPSPSTYNDTTLSFTPAEANPGLQHPSYLTWQQACHSAIGFWEHAKQSPSGHAIGALIQSASKYMESILSTKNATAKLPSTLNQDQESSTTTDEVAGFPPGANVPSTVTKEQTTDAAGRHSPELRGSYMAVVIGLVAGIMWF